MAFTIKLMPLGSKFDWGQLIQGGEDALAHARILEKSTFLRELAGEEYADQLDTIIRNATKLKEVVEILSNVENFQSGAARVRNNKVSLSKIAEDTMLLFKDEATVRNITLRAESQNKPFFFDGDGNKISIALGNLVKNALQFTDTGGHITIKVEEDSGYLKVSVSDDGIGIPAKELGRVFDRFFQVESHLTRRHGGMGLGLSVAKSMIELHGGRIWAESEEGQGSTFTFLLPIEAPAKPAAAVSPFVE